MTHVIIPLEGGSTTISERDAHLTSHKWRITNKPRSTKLRYVYTTIEGRIVYLHRMIMNPTNGMQVDHIDGDGTNNTRENLRIATASQNAVNKRHYKPKSGFRGVYVQPSGRSWQVKITVAGKVVRGGSFSDPQLAAKKYDDLAKKFFGEFAILNFTKDS